MKTKFRLNDYKYLFFDLFHTITYPGVVTHPEYEWDCINVTEREWARHSMETYRNRSLGIVSDPEEIVKDIISSIGVSVEPETLQRMTEIRISRFSRCLSEIKPEITKTLAELYKREYRMCLISNADAIDIMGWRDSPVSGFFDYAVFSCNVCVAKPDQEIYKIAIDKMNADIGRSLFIGDGGSNELAGAKACNLDTVMTIEFIKDLWPGSIEKHGEHADYMIRSLCELLK